MSYYAPTIAMTPKQIDIALMAINVEISRLAELMAQKASRGYAWNDAEARSLRMRKWNAEKVADKLRAALLSLPEHQLVALSHMQNV